METFANNGMASVQFLFLFICLLSAVVIFLIVVPMQVKKDQERPMVHFV